MSTDLKYALRALARQPGYSLVVALTLALGLGLNATIFGLVDAMFLRPFQFRDYERLVVLFETPAGASHREAVAPANYLDWRSRISSLENLSAWEWWDALLTGREEPERVQACRVTSGFFELLSIQPVLGRSFARDEEQVGNHRRIVLGHGLWKRRFGGAPGIVGTQILIEGESYTVVGIAPPGFEFPIGSELWAPLAFPPDRVADRRTRALTVGGKLAAGKSWTEAQAEIELISRQLERQYPETNRGRKPVLRTLSAAFREDSTGPIVAVLETGALMVLLVAVANIAGLLLARGVDRLRELAMRTALGASRLRIVRQLATETVVLGLVASGLALLLARVALDVLRTSIPAEMARMIEGWNNLRLDSRLVLATPVLAITVGLLVGLIPALDAFRTPVAEALKEGERGTTGSRRRQRGRQALVVAEIACALALLVAAGLSAAGGARMVSQPGGFESAGLLRMNIPLPESKYRDPARRREFAAALIAKLEAIPGAERAAMAFVLPASGWSPSIEFVIENQPLPDAAHRPRTGFRSVSPGYFETMRIPILKGRGFSGADREGAEPVVIISGSMAKRFWPGEDAIGKRWRLADSEPWLTIVGVAGDVRMYNWWDGEDQAAMYLPLRQAPPAGNVQAVVRTRGGPALLTTAAHAALRSVDPLLPASNVGTMDQAIAQSSLGLTYLASLIGIGGGIAFVMAVAGIYSLMAYAISQRMHEFGVRMALGATAGDILRLTIRQGGTLAAVGVGIGVPLAVAFGGLMAGALFGVIALDLMTVLVVSIGLALAALAATCIPARRVLGLDPAKILRG